MCIQNSFNQNSRNNQMHNKTCAREKGRISKKNTIICATTKIVASKAIATTKICVTETVTH